MKLNLKTCMLLGTTGLVSVMPMVSFADVINAGSVEISANFDNNDPGFPDEYIYLNVAGQNQMIIRPDGTIIQDHLTVNGDIGMGGDIFSTNDDTVTVRNNLNVTGGQNVDGQSTLAATSIEGNTFINTTSPHSTTIGGFENTTSLLSSTINIGNGSSEEFTAEVNIEATNIRIGSIRDVEQPRTRDVTIEAGNDVNINAVDDLDIVTGDNIYIDSGDTIYIESGDDIDIDVADRITVRSDSAYINVNPNAEDAGSDDLDANGIAIAGNGRDRLGADENGRIVVIEGNENDVAGTTASMFVTNEAGNYNGLVVQGTKTTLSGGTNSASMTLDDRGATFSNPANGAPIQVHGVADGTAPFDAVNVRQLYSGLAAVLASTPDITLAPGRTGMAVGLGGYGGYNAIGIGFGHMYENGATLRASASKADHSEVAYRASVSWNW